MEFFVSAFLLTASIVLCVKSNFISARTYLLFAILAWASFLLTFRLNFLIRSVLKESDMSGYSNHFVAGVLEYDKALLTIKLSLGLLFLSLGLLLFFPIKKSNNKE
jgi:hypothetical protein